MDRVIKGWGDLLIKTPIYLVGNWSEGIYPRISKVDVEYGVIPR